MQGRGTIDVTFEGERGVGNSAKVQDNSQNVEKETSTSAAAMQECGAVDFTPEGEDEQGDGNSEEVQSDQRPDTQRKTIPNNRTALPGRGSLVVAMGGVQQGDDYPTMLKKAKYEPKTCHEGTQTELLTIFPIHVSDAVAHGAVRETKF